MMQSQTASVRGLTAMKLAGSAADLRRAPGAAAHETLSARDDQHVDLAAQAARTLDRERAARTGDGASEGLAPAADPAQHDRAPAHAVGTCADPPAVASTAPSQRGADRDAFLHRYDDRALD